MKENNKHEKWTIITIIIVNLLSAILFFRDPFYLLYNF